MRKVAFIDIETLGLPENDIATEIAIVTVDPYGKSVLNAWSGLVNVGDVEFVEKIEKMTGINKNMTLQAGLPIDDLRFQVEYMLHGSDWLCAHNAEFDKQFILQYFSKTYATFYGDALDQKPWIDTMLDLPFPEWIGSRSLANLCYTYQIPNLFPHRALTDALATAKLFMKFAFDHVLLRAESPVVWVRAIVSKQDKDQAKSVGFWWDPMNMFWVKQVKLIDAHQMNFEFPKEILDSSYKFKEIYLPKGQ